MGLSSIQYMTGNVFGCLKFAFKDGSESNKYGTGYQVQKVHKLIEEPLVKITILKNNIWIVGMKFTHKGGHIQEIRGTNGAQAKEGPITEVDIDLDEDEEIVGMTVEYVHVPTRIGFTIMRV